MAIWNRKPLLLGVIVCLAMIIELNWTNGLSLSVWLTIGLIYYFAYGKKTVS
jgi:basic amino acid/polyamine antiporter, APA family